MHEHPIIFSAPMVRAILEGRKTQTRRVCKGQRELSNIRDFRLDGCPYGQPGDRLWVRETHLLDPPIDGSWPSVGDGFASIEDIPARYRNAKHVLYRADNNLSGEWRWRPSIHMPRWASRITLEITDVRVQRLQDITDDDAAAEGCPTVVEPDGSVTCGRHKTVFRELWDSINESRGFGWNANPWVWALTFKRVED